MFQVSLSYFDQYHNGKLEIGGNELIFTFSNLKTTKIDFVDHMCVYRDDKSKYTDKKDRYILNIITKQLNKYRFVFNENSDCDNCVANIRNNFINCKRSSIINNENNNLFNYIENADFTDINEPSFWRISSLNHNYNVCYSLPENVIVVDGISDQSLIESQKSHNYNRFPTIDYIHLATKSCILISSSVTINPAINQPTRCHVDEAMIAHLSKDVSDKNVYIVQMTTISNLAMSAATPTQQTHIKERTLANSVVSGTNLLNSWIMWTNYNTYTINVLPINQLSMCLGHILISLKVLPPKYYPPNTLFGLATDNSTHLWLNSIYMCVSRASLFVNQMVQQQTIIYLMDETGVDYTLIVSSLCQILLEPTCRTINGFLALIYREWFCNGHPFDLRHFSILPDNNSRLSTTQNGTITPIFDCIAPVFFLFLNCVKIILQKYIRYFEFNEYLLIHLFKYAYECKLGNSEQSRKSNSIQIKHCLLWKYDKNVIFNQIYDQYDGAIVDKFWPHEMELWDSVFLKSTDPSDNSTFSEIFIEKVHKLRTDIAN